MIDAHIHLDQYEKEQLRSLIPHWCHEGIEHVVAVSMNLSSARKILALKEQFGHFILPAIGYHPEQPLPSKEELYQLTKLIRLNVHRLAAIGEVGLPYYERDRLFELHNKNEYIYILEHFLELSVKHNLPVALHAVHDTAETALRLLQKYRIKKAHFHWLKAPKSIVSEIIQQGYVISVTPEVCYRERDQELAKLVPLSQLLIETDGPWSYEGPFKNFETTPLLLKEICKVLANIKHKELEEVMMHTTKNAKKLYLKQNGGK